MLSVGPWGSWKWKANWWTARTLNPYIIPTVVTGFVGDVCPSSMRATVASRRHSELYIITCTSSQFNFATFARRSSNRRRRVSRYSRWPAQMTTGRRPSSEWPVTPRSHHTDSTGLEFGTRETKGNVQITRRELFDLVRCVCCQSVRSRWYWAVRMTIFSSCGIHQ